MFQSRQFLLLTICLVSFFRISAAETSLLDSMQRQLVRTNDPNERIGLLLNLKDANENPSLTLYYSTSLFNEAARCGDSYALAATIDPILADFIARPDQEDSLRYCIRMLERFSPGTPQEGMDCYARMSVDCARLHDMHHPDKALALAHRIRERYASAPVPKTVYEQAAQLLLTCYADMAIRHHDRMEPMNLLRQIPELKKAYALTHKMPHTVTRMAFTEAIYFALSSALNIAHRYDERIVLIRDYIASLDDYLSREEQLGRRPYRNKGFCYVSPYRQLIRSTISMGRNDLASRYFREFRRRMLNASSEELIHNKVYLYEMGYVWHYILQDFDTSLIYNDSLRMHIEQCNKHFPMPYWMVLRAYRNQGRTLVRAGRYEEAFQTYERTSEVVDSLYAKERAASTESLRRRSGSDRDRLEQTRDKIRNRTAMIFSLVSIVLLLIITAVNQALALFRNRRLKADIELQNAKAQESDRMKSLFVNTICAGIGPPFNAIDQAALQMVVADNAREKHLAAIQENIPRLLSTLDNILEAANLDSLAEPLRAEPTDIDEVCQAELLKIANLHASSEISYICESPDSPCTVSTHAKYFAFVIRALLDNASRFTTQGHIHLRYERDTEAGVLRVSVTDSGCGVAPDQRDRIFCATNRSGSSLGLSLSLCRTIAGHLRGSLRLDETYDQGARFIFLIPLEP